MPRTEAFKQSSISIFFEILVPVLNIFHTLVKRHDAKIQIIIFSQIILCFGDIIKTKIEY